VACAGPWHGLSRQVCSKTRAACIPIGGREYGFRVVGKKVFHPGVPRKVRGWWPARRSRRSSSGGGGGDGREAAKAGGVGRTVTLVGGGKNTEICRLLDAISRFLMMHGVTPKS
jgi:hypothetical protein